MTLLLRSPGRRPEKRADSPIRRVEVEPASAPPPDFLAKQIPAASYLIFRITLSVAGGASARRGRDGDDLAEAREVAEEEGSESTVHRHGQNSIPPSR